MSVSIAKWRQQEAANIPLGDIVPPSTRDDAGVEDSGKLGRDDSILGLPNFRGKHTPRPQRKEISPARRATSCYGQKQFVCRYLLRLR
jgi:hypothetical protein